MKINLLAFSADRQLLTSLEVITFNGITLTTTPAGTSSELRALTQQQRFDAALIDAADDHLPVVQTILNLTAQQPGIKILLLVADEQNETLPPEDIAYDRLLSRPLSPEQLISSLKELFLQPEETCAETGAAIRETPAAQAEQEPSLIEIIDAAENENRLTGEQGGALTSHTVKSAGNADPNLIVKELRLSYCCVLLPWSPHQYLTGELSDHAADFLPRLHHSLGWRMTGISIRPQYLQWVISLPVETCPVTAIQKIRQRTSANFFKTFPDLPSSGENRDFWAPGYLMLSGVQTVPSAIIHEFVKRARPADG